MIDPRKDMVNHPSHYNSGKIEVIEAIEDWGLGMHLGTVVKYVARAGKKDPTKEIEDLQKAEWYLKRKIELLKAEKEKREPVRPNDMNQRKEVDPHNDVKSDVCLRHDCNAPAQDPDSDFCAAHMPVHGRSYVNRDQADKHDPGDDIRKEFCRPDCSDPKCDGRACWTRAQLEMDSIR